MPDLWASAATWPGEREKAGSVQTREHGGDDLININIATMALCLSSFDQGSATNAGEWFQDPVLGVTLQFVEKVGVERPRTFAVRSR